MVNRRQFLQSAAPAAVALGATGGVSLVLDSARTGPPLWAAGKLEQALKARGVSVHRCAQVAEARAGDVCIVAGALDSPSVPEALSLAPGTAGGRPVLFARGPDSAGLVYAFLELADRVEHAASPLAALDIRIPVTEQPANAIRSVTRLFTSEVEDKPWFHDREMWPRYLDLLATQRFNRFHLSFGIGYDFLTNVTDGYLLFTYPFLLSVPGYNVRVPQLPDSERDRNLEMLRYISEQTAARGMRFQLGLWMHGYQWIDSPKPNYTIEGLTRQTHGPYCRDAVRALLRACPAIGGVTFRVHGESGVEEGSYEFWKTVFEGVSTCGRTVEIDMHSKGMDQTMLDLAVASGMPVKLSPKFWAEHMGMTYHQADIRELEQPRPDRAVGALMRFSAGSRSFLRYGYGDLLRDGRKWDVLHRIWPGTQRLLLWGDSRSAAAYSRAFSFCGSQGAEICEPLSFKGRRGSGLAGGRCAYLDGALKPRWDWEKYEYSHRVWGRLLYNPAADPDGWRRYLRRHFGESAGAAEAALASASRVLPVITTAHGASAANNSYWPEVYTNQPIVDGAHAHPYRDSPAPRVFGNVSPFDPQLFSRINDFAAELESGRRGGKYSPIEVAQWLEDFAAEASKNLAQVKAKRTPECRRLMIDVAIQAGLGRFFAAKFRAAVLYGIFEKTGDRAALDAALTTYRAARSAWVELAGAGKVYRADITVGEHPQLRGHWADRLPAIDLDIAAMEAKLAQAKPGTSKGIAEALGRPRRERPVCAHTPPARFRPGQPLEIAIEAPAPSVRLHYRHVTQAERFGTIEMRASGGRHVASIPGSYTDSAYPLQYYFELNQSLYPGFAADLTGQPYIVVHRA